MATIEHRSANTWRVGVRTSVEEGRRWIRQTLTFPASMPEAEQRRQAELAAARLLIDVEDGVAVPSNQLTVADFAAIWMDQHVRQNCTPNTVSDYQYLLDSRILPALGSYKLQRLNAVTLTHFINDVRADRVRSTAIPAEARKRKADRERLPPTPRQLSERTVRHYYDCLNYMLNKAVQWSYLPRNPLDRVDRPKIAKPKVKFLDDKRAVDLLRCLSMEESLSFRCAVLLALLCGLRLGEVGALMLDDVDWDGCSINISRALKYTPAEGTFIGTPKSDAGVRVVDLPAGMMALLEETRRYHEDAERTLGDRWYGCGRIVCNWDGTPYHHDTPSKQFRKFADRHGFKGVRFHDLRHTHATLLFASNVDAVAVASRLGHEDASTTLRVYAHAIRRRDRDSANAMQQLLARAYGIDAQDQGGGEEK